MTLPNRPRSFVDGLRNQAKGGGTTINFTDLGDTPAIINEQVMIGRSGLLDFQDVSPGHFLHKSTTGSPEPLESFNLFGTSNTWTEDQTLEGADLLVKSAVSTITKTGTARQLVGVIRQVTGTATIGTTSATSLIAARMQHSWTIDSKATMVAMWDESSSNVLTLTLPNDAKAIGGGWYFDTTLANVTVDFQTGGSPSEAAKGVFGAIFLAPATASPQAVEINFDPECRGVLLGLCADTGRSSGSGTTVANIDGWGLALSMHLKRGQVDLVDCRGATLALELGANATDGTAYFSGRGGLLAGWARDGTISIGDTGAKHACIAIGHVRGGDAVRCRGQGSMAFGGYVHSSALAGDCIAASDSTVQFFPGTNDAVGSLQVGPDLRLHGEQSPIGKTHDGSHWWDSDGYGWTESNGGHQHIYSGQWFQHEEVGTTYTFGSTAGERFLICNNNGAGIAVTVPSGAAETHEFIGIMNRGTGNATLTPASGNIQGVATKVLAQYEGVIMGCDGTDWWIVASI